MENILTPEERLEKSERNWLINLSRIPLENEILKSSI